MRLLDEAATADAMGGKSPSLIQAGTIKKNASRFSPPDKQPEKR